MEQLNAEVSLELDGLLLLRPHGLDLCLVAEHLADHCFLLEQHLPHLALFLFLPLFSFYVLLLLLNLDVLEAFLFRLGYSHVHCSLSVVYPLKNRLEVLLLDHRCLLLVPLKLRLVGLFRAQLFVLQDLLPYHHLLVELLPLCIKHPLLLQLLLLLVLLRTLSRLVHLFIDRLRMADLVRNVFLEKILAHLQLRLRPL